jgi:hypothetical protein
LGISLSEFFLSQGAINATLDEIDEGAIAPTSTYGSVSVGALNAAMFANVGRGAVTLAFE